MRMHNSAAAFAALSALLAPMVLAQQTTMQMWFPLVDPEGAEEFYSEQEAVIKTITNQATVVELRATNPSYDWATVTLTIGRSTFRFSTDWAEGTDAVGLPQVIDCAFTGCPTATTGTCSVVFRASNDDFGTGIVTRSSPIDATALQFHPIALATPLPEADSTQCDSQAAAGTTPSATGGKSAETGTSAPSTENSGWKVAASCPGVAALAALGLFI